MEKVKNIMKKFNKHIGLFSIILLIVFTVLHFNIFNWNLYKNITDIIFKNKKT